MDFFLSHWHDAVWFLWNNHLTGCTKAAGPVSVRIGTFSLHMAAQKCEWMWLWMWNSMLKQWSMLILLDNTRLKMLQIHRLQVTAGRFRSTGHIALNIFCRSKCTLSLLFAVFCCVVVLILGKDNLQSATTTIFIIVEVAKCNRTRWQNLSSASSVELLWGVVRHKSLSLKGTWPSLW